MNHAYDRILPAAFERGLRRATAIAHDFTTDALEDAAGAALADIARAEARCGLDFAYRVSLVAIETVLRERAIRRT